jgi:hypothetical protein
VKNDIILSVVTGEVATQVAKESLPFIKEGKVYADMNTVSPLKMLQYSLRVLEPHG